MYLIKTIKGDITKATDVQAIVNAANNSLLVIVAILTGVGWDLRVVFFLN